ncbi:MAG: sodium:proton antiporter [Chthoniobacteraceae bacterium]
MILAAASIAATPLWLIAPFAALLLCIALGPIAFPHFWHRRYPLIALALAVISAACQWITGSGFAPLLHALEEYAGFIALIASLYIVSGGIHIRVKGEATPTVNCIYLAIGAVLANVIGTTGASMLLIRPWIRMNRYRITAFHVVFFIFIVSNVGGCLTPIGDPPLYMGYLKGVPFWWVLQHCWQGWLVAVAGLIAIFAVIDRKNFLRAPREVRDVETAHETWVFRGLHNLLFLALILFAVLVLPLGWRECVMAAAALGSWFTTKREIHESNDFAWEPVKEVAWLFIGIFVTMGPALHFLQANPPPLASAHAYYWATGVLSATLDNAPTYLAFLATALGQQHLAMENVADIQQFASAHAGTLEAISLGAVFFGAMTYIGNGPNFMVKAIAQHANVRTPSFLGYVVRFALPILLPFLALIGILFFSRWRIFG